MTECEGVLASNPYSIVVTVVRRDSGRVVFGFVFNGDSHRWIDFCKETAEKLASKQDAVITGWRQY